MSNQYVIDLNKVSLGYGNHEVLKDIDLKIFEGEFLSIFGENGAGKTTLFKGILQLLPTRSGSIHILGKDVTNTKDKTWLRTQIGYVPQRHHASRFPISVFDAVLLGRWGTSFKYLKRPSKDDFEIVEEMLNLVKLDHMMHQDCRTLSGGQQQRLNIARALVRNPKILLLDEPNTHLDMTSRDQLDDTIYSARQKYNLSIVMISHDHVHAEEVSDRAVHLRMGQIYGERGA
ncbi:ATP-binding cassette domain-containing protein [Serpentinicella sp. ANB-PHB4]|uniref:metal ABC transporter ATP-binding protein n=1 Tax=Serpentinicella sp. ANB-PHB4 TaxID=3074076 RepID=UPI002854D123|nr:ATP-binding cassette domain-containing protein [Serpentinicella sp. ANB-PHB4]MDR5658824.1 ATP-binding cassette domain-containing protein [Serpentinicella sp. ANB-PHB4]